MGDFERLLDSDEAASLLGIHPRRTLHEWHATVNYLVSRSEIYGVSELSL
jgi:hypothetical protein